MAPQPEAFTGGAGYQRTSLFLLPYLEPIIDLFYYNISWGLYGFYLLCSSSKALNSHLCSVTSGVSTVCCHYISGMGVKRLTQGQVNEGGETAAHLVWT